MKAKQHDLRVTPFFASAIKSRAADEGVAVSALLRDTIAHYAAGAPVHTTRIQAGRETVRIYIDDDTWNAARQRALVEGISVSEAIRAQLETRIVE